MAGGGARTIIVCFHCLNLCVAINYTLHNYLSKRGLKCDLTIFRRCLHENHYKPFNILRWSFMTWLAIRWVESLWPRRVGPSWSREESDKVEHVQIVFFISYLLRFSDRIDRLKKPYGNFFIHYQSWNDFLTREKSVSCNQKSAVKMNQSVDNTFALFLAPLQSSFTEVL